MKKAFDQTLRDIKREVNKKVLKVPSIEQKVLDATSNEPWGPHGSLLADIAMATRNYHEYQMIMAVIWKRLSDTGKNWRHVYKGLTVLEYLVAHGSERVIDEIREHGYQISALSDFQYIDSSGRDQGNNVRRKSQSLVLLVNDKERLQEVRQKAVTNRDKFRSTTAVGGMYKSGSGGYGDDHYGSREDERNGYGRDREWGYRDDEKYGRYRDSYSREGDRYGRDSEDHYGREYRDDGFRGRSPSVDDNQHGSRSRSSERNEGRAYDDDDHHSSRGSSIKPEDHSQNGRPMERKFSEQSLGTPPSYEEAVGDSRSPAYSERGGETVAVPAPQSSSGASATTTQLSSPNANVAPQSSSPIVNGALQSSVPGLNQTVEIDAFNEFDPRGSVSAAPRTSNNAEMDLFGSLSDVFSANPLAIMPAIPVNGDLEADSIKASSNTPFGAATSQNQSFEDSFGDSPFKAIPSDDAPAPIHNFAPMPSSFPPPVNTVEQTNPEFQKLDTTVNNEFSNAFPGVNFDPTNVPKTQTMPSPQYPSQEAPALDILAGILPPAGPLPTSQASFHPNGLPPATVPETPFSAPNGVPQAISSQTSFPSASSQPFAAEPAMAPYSQPAQNMATTSTQLGHQNSLPYSYQATGLNSNSTLQAQTGSLSRQSSDFLGDLLPQTGSAISSQYAPNSAGPLALVPQASKEKEKEKFEPKSTVWADTLSKGLVDLNISGPKCNPLADIGIDFESLNRKEKRMEKPSTAPTTNNVSMGKAMGSGSGIGRASAGVMRPPPNPMMATGMGGGPGMGMGMGGGPGLGMGMGGGPGMGMGMGRGMGMGGYGSMNQPSMGMGMGMNGMGMGQGMQMQPSNGFGPSNMNNHNPMMGRGGYSQQPYGGGYQ